MFKKTIFTFLLSISLGVSACASKSEDIKPVYVSPLQYHNYNCNQIQMEMSRVTRRVNELAGVQDSQAQGDSVALGVGLILFWPALFFMIGDDQKEEIARLKGEYESLEKAAIEKECNVSAQIEEARRLNEERIKKQENQYKQQHKQEKYN